MSGGAHTTEILLKTLSLAGQRGLLATGWGGLTGEDAPEGIFVVDAVPHDWLFPQVAVVVHHGGAGATGTALRAGKPAGICPFVGDQPEAVEHIILTHLHFDHAGVLPDFPHAHVHLHRQEYEAMLHTRSWKELAYDRTDFAHHPRWVLYDVAAEKWMGMDAIPLPFRPQMYLIPLFGHTRGHCGVAIQDGEGWFFQSADTLPTNAQFDLTPNWLNRLVIGPHAPRLHAWSIAHPEVRLVAGRMWQSYYRVTSLATPAPGPAH